MKILHLLSIFLVLQLMLSGCQNTHGAEETGNTNMYESHKPSGTQNSPNISITVGERTYSLNELNEEIEETFNTKLYYHGSCAESLYFTSNASLILGKPVEYDLYYASGNIASVDNNPIIYLVITNLEHPLSTEEVPLQYVFGIKVTEQGMQSDFYMQGHIPKEENGGYYKETYKYLGNSSMCITEIVPPSHEVMSDEWKESVKASLRIYMDKNDFSSIKENNLPLGNYCVYIEGFSAADVDSKVIFEHEDGRIYRGEYYFVHHPDGKTAADLNKVELAEYLQESECRDYMKKLRQNAAFSMEYSVKTQGGQ